MKKIGIITIHNSPNYGACLQSFALYKYLELQSYPVEIIDLHRPYYDDYVPSSRFLPFDHYPKSIKQKLKEWVKGLLKKDVKDTVKVKEKKDNSESKKKFDAFNAQIHLSRPYLSIDDLYDNPPVYDVYLTGSDQVWNPTQPFCIEPYFLTFAKGGKKISYASSIGIENLTKKEKREFRNWLNRYDAISVREESARALLSTFIKKPIDTAADPTFLLDIDYWKSIAVKPSISNYILLFTLAVEPELIAHAKKLADESGKQLVVLNQRLTQQTDGYIPVTDAGPREFLGWVEHADMVINDSFHCTVFSIIMGVRNFYTYIAPWNGRGSRITDLLATYNLSEHLLNLDLMQTYRDLDSRTIIRENITKIHEQEKLRSQKLLLNII